MKTNMIFLVGIILQKLRFLVALLVLASTTSYAEIELSTDPVRDKIILQIFEVSKINQQMEETANTYFESLTAEYPTLREKGKKKQLERLKEEYKWGLQLASRKRAQRS